LGNKKVLFFLFLIIISFFPKIFCTRRARLKNRAYLQDSVLSIRREIDIKEGRLKYLKKKLAKKEREKRKTERKINQVKGTNPKYSRPMFSTLRKSRVAISELNSQINKLEAENSLLRSSLAKKKIVLRRSRHRKRSVTPRPTSYLPMLRAETKKRRSRTPRPSHLMARLPDITRRNITQLTLQAEERYQGLDEWNVIIPEGMSLKQKKIWVFFVKDNEREISTRLLEGKEERSEFFNFNIHDYASHDFLRYPTGYTSSETKPIRLLKRIARSCAFMNVERGIFPSNTRGSFPFPSRYVRYYEDDFGLRQEFENRRLDSRDFTPGQ